MTSRRAAAPQAMPKAKSQSKPIPHLTREENEFYGQRFGDYCNHVRNDSLRADRHAWKETLQKFPRLYRLYGVKRPRH